MDRRERERERERERTAKIGLGNTSLVLVAQPYVLHTSNSSQSIVFLFKFSNSTKMLIQLPIQVNSFRNDCYISRVFLCHLRTADALLLSNADKRLI